MFVDSLKNAIISELENIVGRYVFEPNNIDTRKKIHIDIMQYINYLYNTRRVSNVNLQCDEKNNTVTEIMQKQLVVKFDYLVGFDTYRINLTLSPQGFHHIFKKLGKDDQFPQEKKDPLTSGQWSNDFPPNFSETKGDIVGPVGPVATGGTVATAGYIETVRPVNPILRLGNPTQGNVWKFNTTSIKNPDLQEKKSVGELHHTSKEASQILEEFMNEKPKTPRIV